MQPITGIRVLYNVIYVNCQARVRVGLSYSNPTKSREVTPCPT